MASGGGETDFPAKIPRTAADYEKARRPEARLTRPGRELVLRPTLATQRASERSGRSRALSARHPPTNAGAQLADRRGVREGEPAVLRAH